MNYPYEKTGNRILKLRKDRGMTREKLAELADISVQFLADIEKGRKNMTVTTLRKLSSALLVSTDYIVMVQRMQGSTQNYCFFANLFPLKCNTTLSN